MTDWKQFAGLMDFCAVYFTTQLVRCAAFSFVLVGIVMLLRKEYHAIYRWTAQAGDRPA